MRLHEKIIKKTSFGLLFLTLGLVIFFGSWIAIETLIVPREAYSRMTPAPKNSLSSSDETTKYRAELKQIDKSIQNESPTPKSPSMSQADFKCFNEEGLRQIITEAQHLRLRGSFCVENKNLSLSRAQMKNQRQVASVSESHYPVEDIEIVNLTNGYTAQIFRTNDRTLSTDYIQLREGLNQIQVHYRSPQGTQQTSEVQVLRLSKSDEPAQKAK